MAGSASDDAGFTKIDSDAMSEEGIEVAEVKAENEYFQSLLAKVGEVEKQYQKEVFVKGEDAQKDAEEREAAEQLGATFEKKERGTYECQCCANKVLRDGFLITATDMEGNPAPGYDRHGTLAGLCYACARASQMCCREYGREDLYKSHETPEKAQRQFKKDALKLHAERADVKKGDLKRLRTVRWKSLLDQLDNDPKLHGTSGEYRKQLLKQQLRAMTENFALSVAAQLPEMQQRARLIMQRYDHIKESEAVSGGQAPSVVPAGFILRGEQGHQVQWLSRFSQSAERYFICRYKDCSARGSFYVCGRQFKPGPIGEHLLPAHFVWVMLIDGERRYMLSPWPASAEDDFMNCVIEMQYPEIEESYRELSEMQLSCRLLGLVKSNSRVQKFEDMQMSLQMVHYFEGQNETRTKQKRWSW